MHGGDLRAIAPCQQQRHAIGGNDTDGKARHCGMKTVRLPGFLLRFLDRYDTDAVHLALGRPKFPDWREFGRNERQGATEAMPDAGDAA